MSDDGRVRDFDFVFSGEATSTAFKLGGWRFGAYKVVGAWSPASLAFDHSDDDGATWDKVYDSGPSTPLQITQSVLDVPANVSHRVADLLLACYDHIRLRSVDGSGSPVTQTCTVRVRCWKS
ncbi:MAG: hypothetical protein U1E45_14965 [Geminicoccaceae bacterium]